MQIIFIFIFCINLQCFFSIAIVDICCYQFSFPQVYELLSSEPMCLDVLSYGDHVGYSSSNLACNIYKSHSLLSLPVLSVTYK